MSSHFTVRPDAWPRAEMDDRLRLDLESTIRRDTKWGENLEYIGLYYGPRTVWAAFRALDHAKARAAITYRRPRFDQLREEYGYV